jgi:hypothetical protein
MIWWRSAPFVICRFVVSRICKQGMVSRIADMRGKVSSIVDMQGKVSSIHDK